MPTLAFPDESHPITVGIFLKWGCILRALGFGPFVCPVTPSPFKATLNQN